MPKPLHFRYLEALVELLEDGASVTLANWGAKLEVGRNAVWKMQQTPGFMTWINAQLEVRNEHHVGAVVGKLGAIALRSGSPAHAELYLKALARLTQKHSHDVGGSLFNLLARIDPDDD